MSLLSATKVGPSETEVFEDSREVAIGGRTYFIRKKRGRKHTRMFRQTFAPIIRDLRGIGPVVQKVMAKEIIELSSSDLEAITALLQRFLGPELDSLLDMVYEWSPEINTDREYLEGNEIDGEGGEDIEFFNALLIILGFVYGPFVSFLNLTAQTVESPDNGKEEN